MGVKHVEAGHEPLYMGAGAEETEFNLLKSCWPLHFDKERIILSKIRFLHSVYKIFIHVAIHWIHLECVQMCSVTFEPSFG